MLWFTGSQRVGRDWATEHLLKAHQKAITGLRTFCKLSLQESYKADTIFIILNFEHKGSNSDLVPLAITLNYHPKIGLMANPLVKKSRCLSRTVCPLWRLNPYSLPPGCTESNTVSLHLLAAIILHTFICNFQFIKIASFPYHESDVIYFQESFRKIKLDTMVRLIISMFEDSPVLFLSSAVSRPPLKNYRLASPPLHRHKLNHGHCICHPCPISCLKK